MTNKRYQIRFVKEIQNDGTLITFPELGHLDKQHGQKTLKGCHSRDDAVKRAIECNSDLPVGTKGIVIVEFHTGGARISAGRMIKPYVGANPRKTGTTEWFVFIDREGKQSKVIEDSHRIRQRP